MAKITKHRKSVVRLKPVTIRERHPLLGGPMLARDETLTFIFVNLLDYFMTYVMLYLSHPEVSALSQPLFESNPIASHFIRHWGPVKGMLGFKLTMVIFVCLITQAIAYRSEETSRRVLNLGSLLTGCVVLYSLWLLLRAMV